MKTGKLQKLKWKNLGLLVLSIGLALLLSEILLRFTMPSLLTTARVYEYQESERGKFCRYDSLLGWEGIPLAEDNFEWMDCRHHVALNQFGFRGRGFEQEKGNTPRIMVFGDSFVWGFGVANEHLFTELMQRGANREVEIINMGVSGYGTDQEYLLWQESGYQWSPEMVVLMVYPTTDWYDNIATTMYEYPKPHFIPDSILGLKLNNVPVPKKTWNDSTNTIEKPNSALFYSFFNNSALARLTVNSLSNIDSFRDYFTAVQLLPKRLDGYPLEYAIYNRQPDRSMRLSSNLTRNIIFEFNKSVAERGAQLVVAIAPSVVQVYPELFNQFINRKSGVSYTQYDIEAPNRILRDFGAQYGIPVIDLLPALRKAGEDNDQLYFHFNRHWTQAGHEVVAEVLLQQLSLK